MRLVFDTRIVLFGHITENPTKYTNLSGLNITVHRQRFSGPWRRLYSPQLERL